MIRACLCCTASSLSMGEATCGRKHSTGRGWHGCSMYGTVAQPLQQAAGLGPCAISSWVLAAPHMLLCPFL
jgi:hypothetical protein